MARQTSLEGGGKTLPVNEDGLEVSIAKGLNALNAEVASFCPREPFLIDALALEVLARRIAGSTAPEGLKILLARNVAGILFDDED